MTTVLQAELDFRDAGARRALDASSDEWKRNARWVLGRLANSMMPFTADDLIAEAGLPNEQGINRNNAVGSIFLNASKAGLIRPTGRRTPSKRAGNHGRYQTEWVGA